MNRLPNPSVGGGLRGVNMVVVAVMLVALAISRPGNAESGSAAITAALAGKRVTIQNKSLAMDDVLSRLSTAAGCRITASDHLRDRRLTLGARDVEVANLVEGIRKLYDTPRHPCAIQRTDSGDWILWQDRRANQELERILDAERRMTLSAYLRVIANGVPAAARPEWGEDSIVKSLGSPTSWKNVRALLQQLSESTPQERTALGAGQMVWMERARLTPASRELISETLDRTLPGTKYGLSIEILPENEVWYFAHTSYRKSVNDGVTHTKKYSVNTTIGPVGFSVPPVAGTVIKLPGKPAFDVAADKWKELADFQLHLARTTNITVISDYYHDKRAPSPNSVKRMETWPEVLRFVGQLTRYDLTMHREMLVFRSHQWFYDDQFEVPARLQSRLQASIQKRGYLSFEEIAEVGVLNRQQLKRLSTVLPVAGHLATIRPLLLWYQSLPPATKRTVASGASVDVGRTDSQSLLTEEGELIPLVTDYGPIEAMRISVRTVRAPAELRYEFIVKGANQSCGIPIVQGLNLGGAARRIERAVRGHTTRTSQ